VHVLAALGEEIDLLVGLHALPLEQLKKTALGFLVVGCDVRGSCLGVARGSAATMHGTPQPLGFGTLPSFLSSLSSLECRRLGMDSGRAWTSDPVLARNQGLVDFRVFALSAAAFLLAPLMPWQEAMLASALWRFAEFVSLIPCLFLRQNIRRTEQLPVHETISS
jgi:hypothetical protein